MEFITLAIAEDNALAQKSILQKLEKYNDIKIAYSAEDGAEIIKKFEDRPVDVILMDIEMPNISGIEATKEIKTLYDPCKIIMLTTFDDEEKIFKSILNGASGYLLKDETGEHIYSAIKNVIEGGAAMSPSIAFKALEYIRKQQTETLPQQQNVLSKREIEILTELKNGQTYKFIADKLFVSEGTIRKHIENIYRKLQVNNKINAINKAIKNKWLS